jgi:hypothetical protein
MHVRCYDKWNGRVPTIKQDIELNINIRLLHIPSWWVTILSPYLCIFKLETTHWSLVNFITYLEPLYLLDYNYIVVPLPTGFFMSAYFNGEGVQEFLIMGYCDFHQAHLFINTQGYISNSIHNNPCRIPTMLSFQVICLGMGLKIV